MYNIRTNNKKKAFLLPLPLSLFSEVKHGQIHSHFIVPLSTCLVDSKKFEDTSDPFIPWKHVLKCLCCKSIIFSSFIHSWHLCVVNKISYFCSLG